MKSKEALKHIENIISNDTYYLVSYEEEFEAINKDLKVLQVLKNRLPRTATLRVMEYEGFYLLYNSINCTSITKEEYELLKEWLSNVDKR